MMNFISAISLVFVVGMIGETAQTSIPGKFQEKNLFKISNRDKLFHFLVPPISFRAYDDNTGSYVYGSRYYGKRSVPEVSSRMECIYMSGANQLNCNKLLF